ncbi:hypothetical protein D8B26_006525 [Coccidioides posadasii str. Silveira]|uniref:uncharacterized protein n=1 Tax=Coccidioides posadasii (strain RMSCC 757 / Silveira) TaxID=443226 RepID=UPI001BEE64FE|nr:hypothetical protein D8B26_006525 [Coccidioides posadasii str. Silveira]
MEKMYRNQVLILSYLSGGNLRKRETREKEEGKRKEEKKKKKKEQRPEGGRPVGNGVRVQPSPLPSDEACVSVPEIQFGCIHACVDRIYDLESLSIVACP